MEQNIKVGIVGATGYAGVELIRILLSHPAAQIAALASVSFEGKQISQVYPAFRGICDQTLVSVEDTISASDVVFASVPHGVSEELAVKCVEQGKLLIDLGADFRLEAEEDYKQWYGLDYKHPALHGQAAYALPELFREQIQAAKILGNPGCYPTSIALALAPAAKAGLISPEGIVVDSKSGTTGAGRGLTQNTHFSECDEAFSAYKAASHRHTPEIQQTASQLFGCPVALTFVPHLLPVRRGIFSTIYTQIVKDVTPAQIQATYEEFYRDEPFVRVLPQGTLPNITNVTYSNYCDLAFVKDEHTGRLILFSVIDNMVKGAAGQAIQNMNLKFGLPETTGLMLVPPAI